MSANNSSEEYRVTWLIRRLFRAMAQASSESLADLGITAADRAVMEFLYPREELSVPEIAGRYDVSRQHVQVTVNSLLDKKLLVAGPNPRHKRSPLVSLTAKGRRLFDKVRKRDQAIIDRVFSDIPRQDRRVTHRTLEKLLVNLS